VFYCFLDGPEFPELGGSPDVYEGASAPVGAFVATTSKGAMVALLLRYFCFSGTPQSPLRFKRPLRAVLSWSSYSLFC